jgi:glycosylphosphatidylinositol transamidase (GPIT) subunit GPI8
LSSLSTRSRWLLLLLLLLLNIIGTMGGSSRTNHIAIVVSCSVRYSRFNETHSYIPMAVLLFLMVIIVCFGTKLDFETE